MAVPFAKSVFVNCPFDRQYHALFRPLIFTILYLGLVPRTAFETADGGEPRITKLIRLIKASKFGIHDLSRCKAKKVGEMFRLNMPLELGIDYGCKLFFGNSRARKRFLILETERYRYQEAISDLSGSDIKAHKNRPDELTRVVRDWLVQEANADTAPPSEVWGQFQNFMADHFDRLRESGWSRREINNQPMHELMLAMRYWVREQNRKHR